MKLGLKVVGICLALFIMLILINPIRRSEVRIKDWILKQTPLGSSVEEVKFLISQRGWIADYEWQGTIEENLITEYPGVKGNYIIGAHLGKYQGLPFKVYVEAFWGFNSDKKLIELKIRKTVAGL